MKDFKRILELLAVFVLALLIFNLFTTKILYTDSAQYLESAKEFAGLSFSKSRNMHSWIYPWMIGQALNFSPSLLAAKLFNAIWLIATGLLLFAYTKRKSSFVIWMFSPIVWYMSSWISPILITSFLLLWMYLLFEQYEETKEKKYLIYASLLSGFAGALYLPPAIITGFFILTFFYKKELKEVLYFVIPFGITFSTRLIFDFIFFGLPFISLFREIGSPLIILGSLLGSELPIDRTQAPLVNNLIYLSFIFVVSPFLYKIYRLGWKNFRIFLFLILSLGFLSLNPNRQVRYMMLLAPIIILHLSRIFTRSEIKKHVIVSIPLIIILTITSFGATEDFLIQQDLKQLEKDFPGESFIVGAEGVSEEQAMSLGTLYWGGSIREFIRYSEYKLSLENKTIMREYYLPTKSKLNNARDINFTITYSKTDSRTYEDIKHLIVIGESETPKGFKFIKEYTVLRLFEVSNVKT